MAKILDKLLPKTSDKALKLHHKQEWLNIELESLIEVYEDKKNKEISKFDRKANKKIAPAAYEACDKAEYAKAAMDEKLQKYDVKQYLSHRAVNHKAVKAIFKAVKQGADYSSAIAEMKAGNKSLADKRAAYVEGLERQMVSLAAKGGKSDSAKYDKMADQLRNERESFVKSVNEKYDALLARDKAKLDKKLDTVKAAIAAAEANQTTKYSNPDDVILSVKGLKMYFGGLKAVDDLNFEVKKGEIFGLIGPNGAGKTTVFNCITQFYKPTAGELLFTAKDGKTISLTDYKVHDIVLRGIARTFQNIEVVKEVSVLDNLLIAATRNYSSNLFTQMLHLPLLKKEEKLIIQRADKVLKYMGLYGYRDRLAWGLPYGVLKRIEIARALMCNPQLIILDEPAAGLNESETEDLAQMINKIRVDFGCTILLVEHDMSLVMNICDHICAISFGRKLAYGTPAEVQSSKEVQEAYLGSGGDE